MYNYVQPTYLPVCERIIVIGDVHGDIFRLMHTLYDLNIVSRDMKWVADPPNTIVVQLGDQIDSLSRTNVTPWEVLPDTEVLIQMDNLDNIARSGGGRILSLIGNHEIMNFLGEFSYVSEKSKEKYDLETRQRMFRPGNRFASILAKRNIVLKIGPYLFCHGGILPQHLELVNGNIHVINECVRKILTNSSDISEMDVELFRRIAVEENSILWTRLYLSFSLSNPDLLNSLIDTVMNTTGSSAVFVGHNTVPRVVALSNTRVFLMDTGLSRAYGNEEYQVLEIRTDLNTMEPTYTLLTVKN